MGNSTPDVFRQFKTDKKYEHLLILGEQKSSSRFFIYLDEVNKQPKSLGFGFIAEPYTIAIINFNLLDGYLPYYRESPPEILLYAVATEPTFYGLGYRYLTHRTYLCDGTLDPSETYMPVTAKRIEEARYQIQALSALGRFQEANLPERINMRDTIEAFVDQVRSHNFSMPIFIR